MRQAVRLFFGLFLFSAAAVHGFCAAKTGPGFAGSARRAGAKIDCVPQRDTLISSARVPFVRNDGQISNPAVRYYAKTFGGTVYVLDKGKIVYSLPKFSGPERIGAAVLTELFLGDFRAAPAGCEKSSTSVNLFLGSQPEKWKTGLPAFDKLDFGEVYDGISLTLSARGNNVEKIFVVSPGADPRRIAFRYEGALGLEITDDGKLKLQTALGAVYFSRPVAWQEGVRINEREETFNAQHSTFPPEADPPKADNIELKSLSSKPALPHRPGLEIGCWMLDVSIYPVEVAYALDKDGTIRFELSAYDRTKPLIIDPLLASTFIGGGGGDAVQAITVDSQTNVYVAGYTDSSDFPVTNSPYCSTNSGGYDVFVSKFNADLTTLSASTYLGGSSNDQAFAMAIDSSSRIWIAGYTESTNFPISSAMDSSYNGNGDAFVAILNSSLDSPQATYLGGSGIDSASAIAVSNLSVYIAGYTESGDFPVTNGYTMIYAGSRDAFAVLFTNAVSSNAFKAGTYLGGSQIDQAASLAIEPGNPIYVCVAGYTASGNFPVTNAYQSVFGGSNDAFICRLNALLTNLTGSTFLGGTGNDMAYAVGLDLSNRVYVSGLTHSEDFPRNPSNNVYYEGWTNRYRGGDDVFVTCLTNNLTNLFASTYLGGTADDVSRCIIVDSASDHTYIYLGGYTSSSNFPATRNAYDRSYNGGEDAFLLRLDSGLTELAVSTYLGGGGNDRALGLVLGPATNLLFAGGITASSDFPSSDTAYQNEFGGGASDGFISKFPASLALGTLKWRKFLNGDICSSPAMTLDGTVLVGGGTSVIAYTRDGVQRWEAVTTSAVAKQSIPFEGLGVPAVGTNNIIYINTDSGKSYAINSAGTPSLLFTGVAGPSFWSAIAINNNRQLFFSQLAQFYSVNQSGGILWTNSLASSSKSSPSISSNGTIFMIASDSPARLYALNTNGSVSNIWTTSSNMYSSPALDTNGIIYSASSSNLYAFNPNGTTVRVWQAAGEIYSSPAIGTSGVIYIGAGSDLYAFNPDGTTATVWHTGGAVKSSPAVLADGSAIVGTTNGIYSFCPDGTTNWFFETYGQVQLQSPLIDSEGNIFISDNWYFYALYGSQPPADSAWPMFRRDALRTGNQGLNIADFLRPGGLSVTKGTTTNYIGVGWNTVSNAISYELWRSLTNSTATATRLRRLTQTNYNDSSIDPGRIYYYWVKAKTPVSLSSFSANDSGGVPPYPPAGLSASDGVPTNYVQLSWTLSSNAAAYYVYRSQTNDTNTAVYIGSASSTNYSDHTVAPGISNNYWVTAGNSEAGISGFSSSDSGGIPSSPPGGLTASQGSYLDRIDLSWNSSTGAVSYLVYRHTDNNPSGASLISNVTALSQSDYAVIPSRRYYYWVRATNEFGLSDFSGSAYGWRYLAAPASVSASVTYSNMIRVSWVVGSTDAAAHVVFRSESSLPSTAVRQGEVVYSDSTATNYDDTAITRGISYYYWAAAKNNYGSSSWTAASSPGGTPPSLPMDLDASDGTYSNMVKVTWRASPGAIYYTLYRAETYDPSYAAAVGSSLENYYDDRGAALGVLYYYWVKAANNYGLSGLSAFNSGWRGLVPPADVTATDGSSTSEVSIAWSPASGAASYELWRGTSTNVVSASRLANNISGNTYTDSAAVPGTVYYYWLKSKRGIYISGFSGYDTGYRAIGTLDIGVSDFVFVPTAYGLLANPAAVSFKVTNHSALDMVEPNNTVRYDFYLSRSPVYGASEIYWFGGTNSSVNLSAGSSTRVVLPKLYRGVISIPVWATDDYYVFVYINHCLPSGWKDPNLANNVVRRIGDMISVASATARQPVWCDFDGDGKSDFAVYKEAGGAWIVWLSASSYAAAAVTGVGETSSLAVPGDYDGDGKVDPAVNNEAYGAWRVCLSGSDYQMVLVTEWGAAGQIAVPADYDGDGKVDPAVYESVTGTWRVWLSDSGYAQTIVSGMGGTGWKAVPADYDGDGYADPAVYYDATGAWRVWLSGSSYAETEILNWGGHGWRAVPADYDGDGKIDPAVYYEASGTWYIWPSGQTYRVNIISGCGGSGQKAVPGDYDGDGRVDPAVCWESMGIWRLWPSSYNYIEFNLLATGGEGYHAITAGE